MTIRCAHGDTVLYPLADIELEIDGLPIKVEAVVSETLPGAVLLGRDVPELTQLLGAKDESQEPEEVMVVVTRAQARQHLEEELLRKEQEVISGAPIQEELDGSSGEASTRNKPTSAGEKTQLTKEQRRTLRQQFGRQTEMEKEEEPSVHTLELSAGELRELQERDNTLVKYERLRMAIQTRQVPDSSGKMDLSIGDGLPQGVARNIRSNSWCSRRNAGERYWSWGTRSHWQAT